MPENTTHHEILVIGGGNGGISVAARLRRLGIDDIAIVEPREQHLYQPLFSHVAGGTARAAITVRPQRDVMPKGVEWIRGRVSSIDPDASSVTLEDDRRVTYEHLIVCPGIQHDWDSVPGLQQALAAPNVASHYEHDLAAKASLLLRDLRSGTVVFTQPPGPASCAGASQKPMYQACDYWRATGVRDGIRVIMVVPTHTVFGIPAFDRELERKISEYGIELRTDSELLEVDAESSEVVIGGPEGTERIRYDVLNAVPPQSAPDWLAATPLVAPGDEGGFVEVDTRTLRHPRYGNVWALGDAAATTNSKCGGALRKQTYVLAKNLAAVRKGQQPRWEYDTYSVCPFTVSRSTVVWAEFDAQGQLKPTIPFLKTMYRENRLAWIADRHVLPWVYWNLILKGLV
ncbi:FAD/NAD(P)-binding oxidoreductase [Microbacterium sp. BK668]|uniref:NAD(P)/FAD-dependent oxidoreductase n=1 Tax=Microbacterium sp. BK668 TaxID=2512118 RepID=UPI0010605CE9|nr:FAD/NAD(P)-binding oxidoreductase [Microbacterium sp. BK668]TDN92056.1 sulfide:quinone oxidoreductase [Microbacterium sp. BK668]